MEMQQTKRRKKNSYWRARTHTKPITSSADDGAYVYVCVFVCVCACCRQPQAAYVRAHDAEGRLKTANGSSRVSGSVWLWRCCGAVGRRFTLNRQVATRREARARARERVVSVFIAQHYNHNDIHFRCASDPTLGRKVAGRDRGIQGTNLDFSHARSFIYIICN